MDLEPRFFFEFWVCEYDGIVTLYLWHSIHKTLILDILSQNFILFFENEPKANMQIYSGNHGQRTYLTYQKVLNALSMQTLLEGGLWEMQQIRKLFYPALA